MKKLSLLIVALLAFGSPSRGDDLNVVAEANAIYNLAQSASSVGDFDTIIGRTEQFMQLPLSQAHREYGQQTLAWAFNRRGEFKADEAMELAQKGDTKKATALMGQANADFESSIASNPNYWRPWQNRGISRATAGQFDLAIADFSRVLAIKPSHANAYLNRGEVFFEMGRYDQSIADFNRFLALKPGDSQAHTARGHAYFQLGRTTESLNDYNAAIALNPNEPASYADRGDVHQHLRNWRLAKADYEKVLSLNANYYRTQRNLAWLLATAADETIRNADRAVELSLAVRKAEGDQPTWRTRDILAAAYAQAGDFENAQAEIEQAILAAPKSQADILRQRKGQYLQNKPVVQ